VKIAFVCTSAGFLQHLMPLIRAAMADGHQLHVFCAPGPNADELSAAGAVFHAVPMERRIDFASDLRALRILWRELGELRPDLLHAHNPKGGLLGILAGFARRVPYRIYHLHGSPLLTARGAKRAVFWCVEWLALELATHRVSVSRSLMLALGRMGLRRARHLRVLGAGSIAGIDLDEFRPRSLAPSLATAPPTVAFVGRFIAEKGLSELAEAWVRVLAAFPDARLLLAGAPDGLACAGYHRLVKQTGVRDVGYQRQIGHFLEGVDVLVLPSYREGLSTVVLEGHAAQVAVVGTEVPGIVDLVQPGQSGWLVPSGDADSLGAALVEALMEPGRRLSYGRAGRELVERCYEREAVLAAHLALYRSILGDEAPLTAKSEARRP
jgi:glycosyltransferase involved in cell wall biosynthesis